MHRSILFAAMLAGLSCALAATETTVTPEERAKVIRLLQDSQKEFLDSVEVLSAAQWTYKPGPDRWSVGETAEHIMLAEGTLFAQVQKAVASPPNPEWEKKTAGKTELLERVMIDRSHKAQAPEAIRPQGLSQDEVIRRYKEARAKTLAFAQETDVALKEHTTEHPFQFFNTLNAYQWLIYIPLHNVRHDQQIAEVKASAGYPH
jgi:DinB superfamily